jgi:hypothetical protein
MSSPNPLQPEEEYALPELPDDEMEKLEEMETDTI